MLNLSCSHSLSVAQLIKCIDLGTYELGVANIGGKTNCAFQWNVNFHTDRDKPASMGSEFRFFRGT